MKLWSFVIANGLKWRESKDEITKFLRTVTLKDLQDPIIWPQLTTLVQVRSEGDIFSVRANYGGEEQNTIGLNYLHSDTPLWFTLADCIAAKLLTAKSPKIIRAITFQPDGVQDTLKPVIIAGNPDYRIDPYKDDFYRRVIDQRSEVKSRLKTANPTERATLESTQLTLKILANATSYGNFVELNVEDLSRPQRRSCYGYSSEPFQITADKSEEPGRFFHPLIATLITGAARLMLVITERLIAQSAVDWAFCDTDSMAIAKPDSIEEGAFRGKVEGIRSWFDALNPYSDKSPLLKIEDANFQIESGKPNQQTELLYCLAVSAKRYALFNLNARGEITIRKASAHGLGHLLPPYPAAEAPASIPAPIIGLEQIGVERWQYDVWHQIIQATLNGHPDQVNLDHHPNLDLPAASRYAATTPSLLGWFKKHNEGRDYSAQVRPSNFLLAYQIAPTAIHECPELLASMASTKSPLPKSIKLPKPVAPYDTDPASAAEKCFDRDTGIAIPARVLKTYIDSLAQYHLRPEHKFLNGDYTDRGITQRRHVTPMAIRHIGKETNRWEEQFYLGSDEGAQIDYGSAPDNSQLFLDALRSQIIAAGQRKIARQTGISRRTISHFMKGNTVRKITVTRIVGALSGRTIRDRV